MQEQNKGEDFLEAAWSDQSDLIRQFLDNRTEYEQLCHEVVYILTKLLSTKGIEYAGITSRPKTLNSFLEKLQRKTYENPFTEITDFAAARIVFLYASDRTAIEEVIEAEFTVIEKVDKVDAHATDRFGYGALHYLVQLGRKNSGARYDDLKGLVCEIQVRTVLQDAWAIIDHHLIYKKAGTVPKQLRRKINALAGSFETLDDQFDQIRASRELYIEQVHAKRDDKAAFLAQEVNIDTVLEFLAWRFPEAQAYGSIYSINNFIDAAVRYGYTTLQDLQDLLDRTQKAMEQFDFDLKLGSVQFYSSRALLLALGFEQPEVRDIYFRSHIFRTEYENYKHLVVPKPG